MSQILAEFADQTMPLILQMIGAVLAILLARAANAARDRWGIEIEDSRRDALHSALMTGIAAALAEGKTGAEAIRAAVDHVLRKGAPDAVSWFQLTRFDLEHMARAALQEAQLA